MTKELIKTQIKGPLGMRRISVCQEILHREAQSKPEVKTWVNAYENSYLQ